MCDERLFGPQLKAFSNATVITSTKSDTITEMAQEVLDTAPDRFALAGLSMGGIVAMEVVRLAPRRVERLALMDTNHRAETAKVRANRLPQIEAAMAGNLASVMRNEMKPRYLADGPEKPKILDLCMNMAIDLGPEVFVRQSNALMNRFDQTKTLQMVICRTLVLCGAEDQLCPVSTHQDMVELVPNATLEIVSAAGHLPTLENSTETNAVLSRWLDGF